MRFERPSTPNIKAIKHDKANPTTLATPVKIQSTQPFKPCFFGASATKPQEKPYLPKPSSTLEHKSRPTVFESVTPPGILGCRLIFLSLPLKLVQPLSLNVPSPDHCCLPHSLSFTRFGLFPAPKFLFRVISHAASLAYSGISMRETVLVQNLPEVWYGNGN
jgi:hypothetical protein